MLNPVITFSENIFTNKVEQAAMRDGYGKGVVEAGEKDLRIVVLCADLTESARSLWFKEKFHDFRGSVSWQTGISCTE